MARPQPVLLLPPSEGKAPGGSGGPWARRTMADPALDRARHHVLAAARSAGAVGRGAATLPAMERYTGVLYRELDWPSLPAAARDRGDRQVRIVSGLWGLVAPVDPIPAYRLKMSGRLDEIGPLTSWWRPRLAPVVAGLTEGRVVWDLLPIEHAKAMSWPSDGSGPAQRVTVRFVDAAGQTVAHWNKLLKGALVRWILSDEPTGPEDLAHFEHPLGYRLDRGASVLDGPVAAVVLRQRGAGRTLG